MKPNEERQVSIRKDAAACAVVGCVSAGLELLFLRSYFGTPTGDIPLLVTMGIFVVGFALLSVDWRKTTPPH